MQAAVRYYSRSGNTKLVAEAIAKELGVSAVSVDKPEAVLNERADVLFIGGALYAYGLDRHLKEYLGSLDKAKVGKAVVFSTSWISRHSIDLIRKALEEKGSPGAGETVYVKNRPNTEQMQEAADFARKMSQRHD